MNTLYQNGCFILNSNLKVDYVNIIFIYDLKIFKMLLVIVCINSSAEQLCGCFVGVFLNSFVFVC